MDTWWLHISPPCGGPAHYFRLFSTKIIAHFFHSVKWLKTRSLGRTVCFADQVTQLSDIPRVPSTPDYVPVHDCPHCCKNIKELNWRLCRTEGTRIPTVFLPSDFKSAYHYNFRYQLKLYICLTYLRFPYSIVCGLDYAFILVLLL